MDRKLGILAVTAFAVFAWTAPTHSATLKVLVSGKDWVSTTDVNVARRWLGGDVNTADGLPAYAPYSNPINTSRNLMWYCDPARTDCAQTARFGAGPVEAFFATQFILKSGNPLITGAFQIYGDDFLQLFINGRAVFRSNLDDNKGDDDLPIPIIFDVNGFDLTLRQGNLDYLGSLDNLLAYGRNTFVIQGMDGAALNPGFPAESCLGIGGQPSFGFCAYDRGYEHVSIAGSIFATPEPGSLALLGLGLAGLGLTRRRKAA